MLYLELFPAYGGQHHVRQQEERVGVLQGVLLGAHDALLTVRTVLAPNAHSAHAADCEVGDGDKNGGRRPDEHRLDVVRVVAHTLEA